MRIKIYISLFLWLSFLLLVISHFMNTKEKEELKAIDITKNSVLKAQQKHYDKEINKTEILLEETGNNHRDRKVQDTVLIGRTIIDSLFENGEIKAEIIMPFLSKYYYNHEGAHSEEEEIRHLLEGYKGDNEVIKSIDNFSRYQYAYDRLFDHHNKFWDGRGCGFDRVSIAKSSDSTLAFAITALPNYIELPEKTIQFINQEDNKEKDWKLQYDKNSTQPIIFQINTYTKTDTTRKRYQIKPQKGKQLKTFDYEEIE